MNIKVGFIGCGNMAQAMINGLVNSKLIKSNQIIASNLSREKLEHASKNLGILMAEDNKEVVNKSEIIVLAVKPDKYLEVIKEIKDYVNDNKIIVSIAAGISMNYVKKHFNKRIKLVRAMPNISVSINEGMTAICYNEALSQRDIDKVINMLNILGAIELVDEILMDSIPAISASSPAYVFMFIEALVKGSLLRGIPIEKAYKMAAQTVMGSAKMVLEIGNNTKKYTDMVCSPSGCTIEALKELEKNNFNETIISAMNSCTNKVISMANNT